MSKHFKEIESGLREAIKIGKGKADPSTYRVHVPEEVDVKAIRQKTGLSQSAFSLRYGFKLDRVQDWEQKRSRPDGAVRAYLLVIDRKREAVDQALKAGA